MTSLFLAQGCAVCDRPTLQTFCLDCQQQIQPPCAEQSQFPAAEAGPLPVMALGIYHGRLKRAILAMKYSDHPDIAQPLGAALGQQWLAQQPFRANADRKGQTSNLYALPIPLHASRYRERGYNQAELIARSFAQVSGLPLLSQGLVRSQATLPMHQLKLQARQQNLAQAFQVGSSLRQITRPRVLLIDDIYTTGTTVQSAADTLTRAGICVMGVLVIARATL